MAGTEPGRRASAPFWRHIRSRHHDAHVLRPRRERLLLGERERLCPGCLQPLDRPGGLACPAWQAGWIASPPSASSLYSYAPGTTQADGVTSSFYDPSGNLVQQSTPGLSAAENSSGAAADVDTTLTAYDADGNAYCTVTPTNAAAGKTCPSTPPTSAPTGTAEGYETEIYDVGDNLISDTDPVGDTTSYTYDAATGDQLTVSVSDTGSSWVTTACDWYYYQSSSSCGSGTPATGGGLGSAEYSTTGGGVVTTTTYEPSGSAETTTTPAGTTTDGYDVSGDLTSTSYSATAVGYSSPANVTYTYNTDGTRHTMTDGTGTTTYTYDDAGDTTAQQFVASATGLASTTVEYGYGTAGTIGTITYPSYGSYSSPQATYSYDADGNMISKTLTVMHTIA